jgi:hypothetical protein
MQMVISENVTFGCLLIISNLIEVLVGISYPFSFSSYRPSYCILVYVVLSKNISISISEFILVFGTDSTVMIQHFK